MGWHFVGRVRNNTFLQQEGTNEWLPVKSFYTKATRKARSVLSGLLAKANPVPCHFYTLKEASALIGLTWHY